MICIKRDTVPCPTILKDKQLSGNHYNKPEVVSALFKMQHGKCCYCERNLPNEGHDKHVEHFRPKSKPEFDHLRNNWQNLLLACPQCNGKKSEEFPVDDIDGKPLLIDPSDPSTNPEDHITFEVDINNSYSLGRAICKNSSPYGEKTIEVTGIGSSFFKDERADYFFNNVLLPFKNLFNAKKSNDPQLFQSCQNEFRLLMNASSRYSAFVKTFARIAKIDQYYGIAIPN